MQDLTPISSMKCPKPDNLNRQDSERGEAFEERFEAVQEVLAAVEELAAAPEKLRPNP
jgi:hypothetical protein